LIDNSYESNSLYKALLLQDPLMAHDDGNSWLTNKLTCNIYFTSCLLLCIFDGLIVTYTLLTKFGCGEQSDGPCFEKLLKSSLVIAKDSYEATITL